jgi:putative tryptophan/tyrosine transport system substrate-binding protein
MRRRDFIAAISGGAALASPLSVRAQQRPLPVIGYLNAAAASEAEQRYAAIFRRGLAEQGYIDGRNVEILYLWAENQYDRLPPLVAELVRRRVAVIASVGSTPGTLAAKAATLTLPIVFAIGGDPVQLGLVARLNRPGGNVTGATFRTTELTAKRFELLHEIVPASAAIGFLVNPTSQLFETDLKEADTAARHLGVNLLVVNARTPSEIEAALGTLIAERIGALVVQGDVFFFEQVAQLATFAAKHALPVIHAQREFADAGGLVSYGPDASEAWRIAGNYVGRILKGEKPADLPVQQSTRIEMVLNLKTAKALGIDVPTATLLRATEVIE